MMKAKKKITWIWSILPVLVMLMGLLSTTALAAGSTPATTTADFNSNPATALGLLGSGASWDSSTKTLTLNGVDFTTNAATAVKLPEDSTIVLHGVNTIKGGDSDSSKCYGIYIDTEGNLTIQGDGTLNVTGGKSTVEVFAASYGIYTKGNITITGGTVNAYGGEAGDSYGIRTEGNITITGGTVNAYGGEAGDSYGIYAYGTSGGDSIGVNITSGTVTAIGGTATDESCGIYTRYENVNISGGTVTATGGTADESYGIYKRNDNVNISGGTVTATGGTAYDSYGIYTNKKSVNISGAADVTATGGTATNNSYGIYADYKVNITGATVKAYGGEASTDSYGIYVDGIYGDDDSIGVNITSGTVTAIGGTAYDSYGIYTDYDNVNITGGTVNANGGEAENKSYGIYTYDDNVNISGGTVNAIGGTATYESYGIYADGYDEDDISVKISGGATVTATGGTADESYGIYADYYVKIASGTANANGGTAKYSYGIYAEYDVNIAGGTVNANGGTATNKSYGIYTTEYDVNIAGGTVTAAGKSDAIKAENVSLTTPGIKTISFEANSGTGAMQAYTDANTYTLPANGFTAPSDKQFNGWKVGSENKVVGDSITVSKNITVTALWKADEYNVTVTNGKATVGAGTDAISKAEVGATVTLTADPALSGQVFDKWIVESGSITLADANSATTTFTMPAGAVSVKATYHTHSYGSDWKTDASKHWHECSCGDKSAEAVHTAGDWIIDTSATATTAGTKHKECTDCGYVMENGTIPATGVEHTHSYGSEWKSDANKHWHECACSAKSAEAAHTAGDWIIDTPATATTAGSKHKACTVCGYVMETDTIPATGYTVSFDANGGSVTPASAVTGADGKLTSLPTPTHSGSYSFNGWYTAASGGTKVETSTIFNADTTIYAQWTYTGGSSGGGGGSSSTPTHKVESEVSKDADGSVSFSKSSAKKGDAVTITVTPDRYYKVDSVTVKDKNGKEIAVTDNGDGTFTFQMPDSQVAVEPVFSWDNPFTDVAENTYYTPAVEWALKNDVTGGTTTATFSPNTGCTRAQIVTFLWRAAGCPEPAGSKSFTDVSADAYYAKAVAWAAEQGITGGTGDGKFSPDAVCTRSQSMTFIYRSEQAQGGGMQGEWMFLNPFADVNLEDYYGEAVMWAVANGVTDGTSDTTFSPNATCTRGQIVTFLYRFFVK